jgi:hypothetical protein
MASIFLLLVKPRLLSGIRLFFLVVATIATDEELLATACVDQMVLSPPFKVPLPTAYLTGRHEADAGPRKLPRPLSTKGVETFGLSLARWR